MARSDSCGDPGKWPKAGDEEVLSPVRSLWWEKLPAAERRTKVVVVDWWWGGSVGRAPAPAPVVVAAHPPVGAAAMAGPSTAVLAGAGGRRLPGKWWPTGEGELWLAGDAPAGGGKAGDGRWPTAWGGEGGERRNWTELYTM